MPLLRPKKEAALTTPSVNVRLLSFFLVMLSVANQLTTSSESLSFVSYNSQGLGPGRKEYISELLLDHDFVCVQEHWLFESGISGFENSLNNASVHAVSGMVESEFLQGRPYGGVAIIWRNDVKQNIIRLTPRSKRICAVIICFDEFKVLLCSVYMPQKDNYNEYEETLGILSELCSSNGIVRIVIGGDFNIDMARPSDRNFNLLHRFITRESLFLGTHYKEIDYTFESKINGAKSKLDYFMVSENLVEFINEHKVRHEVDNPSDHSDLIIGFDIPIKYMKTEKGCSSTGPNWKRALDADIANYKLTLDHFLDSIVTVSDATMCRNNFCRIHEDEIETLHEQLVNACVQAGEICIPHSERVVNAPGHPIHGWNDRVKHVRESALFWHNLWKSIGSPRQGAVADIRRATRAKYHFEIRRVKTANKISESNKLAESLLDSDSRVFWSQVNKIKGKNAVYPNTVDEKTEKGSIADLFADKYEALYSSVSYDENEMQGLLDEINSMIDNPRSHVMCDEHAHVVTPDDVHQAIKQLNRGKHEGKRKLFSDHLINGTERFNEGLANLFTAMLTHGYVPRGLREATVFPIPKNKRKSPTDSENYRGITLSSIFGKVLDHILLAKHKNVFSSCDLQFGFKKKSSTTQCTFVLNETVQYYTSRGSGVYSMFLDASKAFDRVHYIKMFKLLLKKGCCPITARFLAIMYTNQEVNVSWNGSRSKTFGVKNGIKQGGVLSPILFCVYLDELLVRLRESGHGCFIGTMFMGAFAYADDIVLLSPTRLGLRKLLDICNNFSTEYHVNFNPTKSQLVYYRRGGEAQPPAQPPFIWAGQVIDISLEAAHLGHSVGDNVGDSVLNNAINGLYVKVNTIMSLFGYCHSDIKYKLFKSFAMALYGSSIWDLSAKSHDRFLVVWRKCVRKIYAIPYRTHCNLLPLLCSDMPPSYNCNRVSLSFLDQSFKVIIQLFSSAQRFRLKEAGQMSVKISPILLAWLTCQEITSYIS